MTNEERRKATEWFRNRAKNCPMHGARRMYEIATEALEERERNEHPLTNADRIRSMTDKELADFLCDISGGESCTYCVANDLCHNGHNGMIEWLKEEAKGDSNEGRNN